MPCFRAKLEEKRKKEEEKRVKEEEKRLKEEKDVSLNVYKKVVKYVEAATSCCRFLNGHMTEQFNESFSVDSASKPRKLK